MKRPITAILGGSGLNRLALLENARQEVGRTPYGDPSAPLLCGELGGNKVVFLPRHGLGHHIPPHRINYRANLWALKEKGVQQVIGVAAVGSIDAALAVGQLVLPTQIIDYTYGRAHTFFDGENGQIEHIDFTEPYHPALRKALLEVAGGLEIADGGVYAATQGPRLETAAEIDCLERDGATLVGMTGMPEAALARELNLPYVNVSVVVNQAAGRGKGTSDFSEIRDSLETGMAQLETLLKQYFGV